MVASWVLKGLAREWAREIGQTASAWVMVESPIGAAIEKNQIHTWCNSRFASVMASPWERHEADGNSRIDGRPIRG